MGLKQTQARARRWGGAVVALVVALGLLAPVAHAQNAGKAEAGLSCPKDELAASPIGQNLREMALRPGEKIDPASFLKDPEVAAFVGQMTRQAQARQARDYYGLCRYRAENAALAGKTRPQTILLGDSITENWKLGDPAWFSHRLADRGIGGQTSAQILLRFYPDVVALRPAVVHIMAGTNDILHDNGVVGDEDIIANITAMIDLAQHNHIKVVLASILPISVRAWQPELKAAGRIRALNARLAALAAKRRIVFVDYFSALADADGGLDTRFGNDGVHPNRQGYAVMRPLAEQGIRQALRAKK